MIKSNTKFRKLTAGAGERVAWSALCLAFIFISLCVNGQQTYSFTTASATGSSGPTQTQLNTAYASTNLSLSVVSINGIQSWTVINSGLYLIDVSGASGGNTNSTYNKVGGLGSRMQGQFNLSSGDVLTILVGQKGVDGCGTGGGGGGTYVVKNGSTLLIAAGGGGGATSDNNGAGSVTVTAGTNDNPGGAVAGGTNGLGGQACNVGSPGANHGGGGGGYLGNGATSTAPTPGGGGFSFTNGGAGGSGNAPGGFGGGGGGTTCTVGGGGGYSGGAGGQQVNYCMSGLNRTGGGGGGSYNSAISQTNTAATNSGNGIAIVKELCNVNITSSGSNSITPAICSGTSLTLTTNAASNYTWSTGNNTSTTIVVSPTVTTTYSLTGTSTTSCIASAVITVSVSPGVPVLSIVNTATQICLGRSAVLTASGATTYTWTNGITNGVAFNPTTTATYSVSGQNPCGISTASTSISIAPLSVNASISPSIVCAGDPSTISVVASANSFTWAPLQGSTSNPSLAVTPTATTIYTITASDGTCSGVTNITLTAKPVPTITSVSSSSSVCQGQTSTLTAFGGISYTWSPGNIVANSITVSPTAPTLYSVVGTNTAGCFAKSSQAVLAGVQPTLSLFANSNIICVGDSILLTATGANTYTWSTGINTATTLVSPAQSTIYTVVGTNTASTCQSTQAINVDVYSPTLAIAGTTAICTGGSSTLSATGGNTYTWNPGSNNFATYVVSPPANTIYSLSASSTSNNITCMVSGTVQVIVNPLPVISASASRTLICRNETVTLTAQGASTYTWSNSSGNVGTGASISVTSTLVTAALYNVTGTSAQGCNNTKSVAVVVSACNGLTESVAGAQGLLVYPNPSQDSFSVESGREMSLVISNELGQVVRELQLTSLNNFRVSVSGLENGVYFVTGAGLGAGKALKVVVTK